MELFMQLPVIRRVQKFRGVGKGKSLRALALSLTICLHAKP